MSVETAVAWPGVVSWSIKGGYSTSALLLEHPQLVHSADHGWLGPCTPRRQMLICACGQSSCLVRHGELRPLQERGQPEQCCLDPLCRCTQLTMAGWAPAHLGWACTTRRQMPSCACRKSSCLARRGELRPLEESAQPEQCCLGPLCRCVQLTMAGWAPAHFRGSCHGLVCAHAICTASRAFAWAGSPFSRELEGM